MKANFLTYPKNQKLSLKLSRVFLSLPSVSEAGFPLVTSLFSSESRNIPQTQTKQKAGRRIGQMTPANERKSRAASYSLNRKVMAKIIMSSIHPVPGLDLKGLCSDIQYKDCYEQGLLHHLLQPLQKRVKGKTWKMPRKTVTHLGARSDIFINEQNWKHCHWREDTKPQPKGSFT